MTISNKEIMNISFERTISNTSEVTTIKLPVIPQAINYSYSPIFDKVQTLGRPSPMYQYSGGTGASYSFNITVHESMVPDLEEFVNNIKSLSHPSIDENYNFTSFPTVLMNIGEIYSYVLVTTDIAWKLPINKKGKYTLVDISFDIKELEELPLIETSVGSFGNKLSGISKDVLDQLEFQENNVVYYSEELVNLYNLLYEQEITFESLYGIDLPDLFPTAITELYGETIETTWDGLEKRLNSIFGAYETQLNDRYTELISDTKDNEKLNKVILKDINTGIEHFKEIKKLQGDIYTIDLSNKEQLVSALEDLENFRKQHHTFISEYRRKYVDSVTADDVKLIKTNVDNIIDQMKKIISEVIGYGRAT